MDVDAPTSPSRFAQRESALLRDASDALAQRAAGKGKGIRSLTERSVERLGKGGSSAGKGYAKGQDAPSWTTVGRGGKGRGSGRSTPEHDASPRRDRDSWGGSLDSPRSDCSAADHAYQRGGGKGGTRQ